LLIKGEAILIFSFFRVAPAFAEASYGEGGRSSLIVFLLFLFFKLRGRALLRALPPGCTSLQPLPTPTKPLPRLPQVGVNN